jgi:hypothetical protein
MGKLSNRSARQILVFLAVLAFVVVSSVVLAHGHPDARSVDESHCAMCMAVHSATHVVATPIITLYFAAIESQVLFRPTASFVACALPLLNQDRAPPSL